MIERGRKVDGNEGVNDEGLNNKRKRIKYSR